MSSIDATANIEHVQADEQAADLARLHALAQQQEGALAAPQQDQAEQAAQAADPVQSLTGLLMVGGYVAGAVGYKRVADIWTETTCRGLAERAVPVLVKYPWGQRVIDWLQTGAGVEELALLLYAAPLLAATVNAAKADHAERQDRNKAKAEANQEHSDQHQPVARDTSADTDTTPEPGPDLAWAV